VAVERPSYGGGSGAGVTAVILVVCLAVIGAAAAYFWLKDRPERPPAYYDPADPRTPRGPDAASAGSDLPYGFGRPRYARCALSELGCRLETYRHALGGDLESALLLAEYYLDADGPRDPVERHMWAAVAACSVTLDSRDFARQRVRADAEDYLEQLTPQMSSGQLGAARALLVERIGGLGAPGYLVLSDMHLRGCALERDIAQAGGYLLAAAEFDGFAGEIANDRWLALSPRLTNRESALARRYAEQSGRDGYANPLATLEADLRADEIAIGDVQVALIDLGHLRGSADGVIGPMTRDPVERFQRCEGLSADGELSPSLRVRIIKTAAHGALPEDDYLPLGQAACHSGRSSPHSALVLGMMYMSGVGVTPDLDRAEAYLRAAARQAGPALDRRFKVSGRANLGLALLAYKHRLPEAESSEAQRAVLGEACAHFARADSYPGVPLAFLQEDIAQMKAALDPYLDTADCKGPIRR